MKVLFLNPPFLPRFSRSQRSPAVTRSGTLYYPLWLAYAAGYLEKHGHEVKLIDAAATSLSREETYHRIREFTPCLVIVDTSTPTIYNDIEIADAIASSLPRCVTVLVGTHVSALAEESLNACAKTSIVARGEYDQTILELTNTLAADKPLSGIAGTSIKQNGVVMHNPDRPPLENLDDIPFVSSVYKKHLCARDYFFAASLYPEVQIMTARGCPFRCFFCLWPQAIKSKYRTRSPANVAQEFLYIKEHLPEVKGVVIEDDTFTVDKSRVLAVCDELIRQKAVIPWNANVRTDLDFSTLKRMKEAGCYLIITGIESGSQEILDNINKGLKTSNIQAFFDNAKRLGLLVHAAFMAGNPGETEETLELNLKLAKRYLPDTLQFFPLMPYPGTQAYEWARSNGYLKIGSYRDYLTDAGLHNCVIDVPGLSSRRLVEWCNASRKAYYLSGRYLGYKLGQVIRQPAQFMRTYKAFVHFRKHLTRTARHD
jgi:anaerobic magnesium-protoporphyrin IX monomethyl ester cyclase